MLKCDTRDLVLQECNCELQLQYRYGCMKGQGHMSLNENKIHFSIVSSRLVSKSVGVAVLLALQFVPPTPTPDPRQFLVTLDTQTGCDPRRLGHGHCL